MSVQPLSSLALPPPAKVKFSLAESVKNDDTSKVVGIWNMQKELVRQREERLAQIKPSASTKNLDPNTNS